MGWTPDRKRKSTENRVLIQFENIRVINDHSLWAREEEKRNHDVVRRLLDEAGNNTIFTPIVMSACGVMGPSMVAFLKEVYGRAKGSDKFLMSQQPALKYSWNTVKHDGGLVFLGL